MKQYTSQKERKRFYELHQVGETYEEIAAEYEVSPECVRMWCRRQRDGGDVTDRFFNPRAGTLSQFTQQVRDKIYAIRQAQKHKGPASILIELHKDEQMRGEKLPSRASIGRYLHEFSEFRHTGKKVPT